MSQKTKEFLGLNSPKTIFCGLVKERKKRKEENGGLMTTTKPFI
jgi:hypothetical protein